MGADLARIAIYYNAALANQVLKARKSRNRKGARAI
jgi:hypothetical protein